MFKDKRVNDTVHWYINELGARVVAESGIVSDRHHLGKLILQGLKDAPDFILQIDGASKESETNSSVLRRSIRCATALTKMGIICGDTIILMAPNHLDLTIPYYAALYLGVVVAPIDCTLTVNELESAFDTIRPKLVICQSEKVADVRKTLHQLHSTAEIITFDVDDHDCCSFNKFLNQNSDHIAVEDFKPTDFDPDETLAMLIPTSGTMSASKSASVSHKNFAITLGYLWLNHCVFPTPTRLFMIVSPLQWLSAIMNFILSPILRYTRLQSSLPLTPDHMQYLINTYKPTLALFSPPLMTTLVKHHNRDSCDMTCFETILLGGAPVSQDLLDELKEITPKTDILNVFGMIELTCMGFLPEKSPPTSVGKPLGCYEYKIVDVETNEDITGQPNTPGELWIRGPGIFKGYYNNEKATEEAFSEGWFKTGDLFYRDEQWNFFFVEKIKLLLKYKSHQIAPVELEEIIKQNLGVTDVAVIGIPHEEFGELPCACVVKREGHDITAQEIKDLVRYNLTERKQLAGGVVFFKELPMTSSMKIHRRKLKEVVSNMERE